MLEWPQVSSLQLRVEEIEKAAGGGVGGICAQPGPSGPDWLYLLSWMNMALQFLFCPQISSKGLVQMWERGRASVFTRLPPSPQGSTGWDTAPPPPPTSGATETKGVWTVLHVLPWLSVPASQPLIGTDGQWSVTSLPRGP